MFIVIGIIILALLGLLYTASLNGGWIILIAAGVLSIIALIVTFCYNYNSSKKGIKLSKSASKRYSNDMSKARAADMAERIREEEKQKKLIEQAIARSNAELERLNPQLQAAKQRLQAHKDALAAIPGLSAQYKKEHIIIRLNGYFVDGRISCLKEGIPLLQAENIKIEQDIKTQLECAKIQAETDRILHQFDQQQHDAEMDRLRSAQRAHNERMEEAQRKHNDEMEKIAKEIRDAVDR